MKMNSDRKKTTIMNPMSSQHTIVLPHSAAENLSKLVDALNNLSNATPSWLTTKEAADHLRMTPKSVREAAKRGDLTAKQLPGGKGQWRFRVEDLDAYLTDGDAQPAKDISIYD